MPEWFIVLLGALGGAIPGIITMLASRAKMSAEADKLRAEARKIGAEASDTLADSAVQLIEPLRKRVVELEERVSRLECENRRLRDENAEFCKTIGRLRDENAHFTKIVEGFRGLIRALWEGVIALSAQLEDGMLSPGWHLEQYRQAVEMALKDSSH